MHEVHSSGHFDRRADVSGYFDKAINNLVEHCETSARLCSNDLHSRVLSIWVTLLYEE